MRIVVISDSHGNIDAVERIIARNPNTRIFMHLGDGEREFNVMRVKDPELDLRIVAGNCDYNSNFPMVHVIDTEFARIMCTHGHRYSVKEGTEVLRSIALDNDCSVALYGHTHRRLNSYSDGIYLMNPGSCSQPRDGKPPSYGYIDLTTAGIVTNVVDL